MKHRILVLGAGYAGAFAAGTLARRLAPEDAEVVLVNAVPDFVERLRMHQVAAGQELKVRPLADMYAGTGVDLRIARVTAVDPDAHSVDVAYADGGTEAIGYDSLFYALGSAVDRHGVPGVAEHAHEIASRPGALRLRERLRDLDAGARVLFVGEGLTGIEGVTEIAESYPHLEVALAARDEPGAWLSQGARRHLHRAFERFGITVHARTEIERVRADGAVAADGTVLAADATVWTGGFAAHPIAAASGLAVADSGQVLVDGDMRSLSHPDVWVAGDAVRAVGSNGLALPMSCASAGFTAMKAMGSLTERLTGRRMGNAPLIYYGNHISLGRRDAIIQALDREDRSLGWYFGGRTAARVKNSILKVAAWSTGNPTFGMPVRRRAVAAAPARTAATA